MRVLLCTLVLLLGVFGVSSQPITGATLTGATFRVTAGDINNGYTFTDATNKQYYNPTISLTPSTNVTISLEFSGPHPFGLSFNGSTAVVSMNQAFFSDQLSGLVTATGSCDTTAGAAQGITVWLPNKTANANATCVLTVSVPAAADGYAVFYRCAYHRLMVGAIALAGAPTTAAPTTAAPTTAAPTTAAPTTAAPTTAAPTTAAPTTAGPTTAAPTTPAPTVPQTGKTLTGNSFRITGAIQNTGYIFTANGQLYLNPTLSVNPNTNVTFSLEYGGVHPFGLSPTQDNPPQATIGFFPNDLNKPNYPSGACDGTLGTGTPAPSIWNPKNGTCTLTITIPAAAAGRAAAYRCAYHQAMQGVVTVSGGSNSATSTTGAGAGLALVVALVAALMA